MLSKKDQTKKKCRLRPKPSAKNAPKITQEERDYLEWMKAQALPCFVCSGLGDIVLHHIKLNSTDKKRHFFVLPMCVNCHAESMELSAHKTPVKFRAKYPIEIQEIQATMYYKTWLRDR